LRLMRRNEGRETPGSRGTPEKKKIKKKNEVARNRGYCAYRREAK